MKRRSLLLIVLIVLLPVGLLAWFGVRMAADEQQTTQQRFRNVMEQRLQDVSRLVTTQFESTERRLQQITAIDEFDVTAIRQLVRGEPQVTQLFVLKPDGGLLYPNPEYDLNGTEQSFLRQASRMFTDRDLQNTVALAEAAAGNGDFAPAVPLPLNGLAQNRSVNDPVVADALAPRQDEGVRLQAADQAPAVPASEALSRVKQLSLPTTESARIPSAEPAQSDAIEDRSQVMADGIAKAAKNGESSFLPSSGWFVWYWDRGLNLIYWQRRPSGHIVGVALERARWIADMIAVLPETEAAQVSSSRIDSGFRVVNSSAEVVYEWGQEPELQAEPFCEVPLAAPLASWRIQCLIPNDQLSGGTGRRAVLSLTAGLVAFALTLMSLAWLLYRDYSRDMREATRQVSFVNQVSHELKTPLTNIRMYAELLDRDLDHLAAEHSEKPRLRLEVITSEAQRLGRLIGNVLTFAGQQRKTLRLQTAEVHLFELVRQITNRFAPSLTDHGIAVTLTKGADLTLWLDPDFVEQILGNLISNVEKYAASGMVLSIQCATSETDATLDCVDAGPGIPASQKGEVFRPFARLSNDLRASTGTGIGLSIARDLARLHGGDVVLKESIQGCWFQVRLRSMPPDAPS